MASIRSHYVPQFYLKYFLPPGSKTFCVYDKRDLSEAMRTPINTAVIGDFYVFNNKNVSKNSVELFLSDFEEEAKSIFDKWISHKFELRRTDRIKVASFLAFMFCRVPRTIEAGKEIGRIGLDHLHDKIKEIANDPIKLKEHYEGFCTTTGKSNNISIDEFAKISSSISRNNYDISEKYCIAVAFSMVPEIFNQLIQLNWNLFIAKGKHFFITNDTPLNVFIYYPEKRKAIFGGGFADPNVEVSFPISPKMCLVLNRKHKSGVEYVDEPFIAERNRRAAFMAEQLIISTFQSNKIRKLLQEFSWTYKKPKLDYNIIMGKFKKNRVASNF